MSEPKFRIAIIGAGISGLTFTVALHKLCGNISIEIYEAALTFTEIGTGISIWPCNWEIMESLGLADDLHAIGRGAPTDNWAPFEYRKSDKCTRFSFLEVTNRGRARVAPPTHLLSELALHFADGSDHPLCHVRGDCLSNTSLWAINTVTDLPTYMYGDITLVGDAVTIVSAFSARIQRLNLRQAHTMAPHQGAGAGQAFEDGYVLASLLAQPSVTCATLARALHATRSCSTCSSAREQGMLYQLMGPGFEDLSVEGSVPRKKLNEVGRKVEVLMGWLGSHTVNEEQDRALGLLEELMS
ncbi:hypothetical protein B0H21DRAFT_710288 [Amylocystis lapponica]|nr:hypothetical protein B0H21DRAFT_710288 [Amylocystis lapponica]